MKRYAVGALAAFMVFSLTGCPSGHPPHRVWLDGTVIDAKTNVPLANAVIDVWVADEAGKRESRAWQPVQTKVDGRFTFEESVESYLLSSYGYTIRYRVSKDGYEPVELVKGKELLAKDKVEFMPEGRLRISLSTNKDK